MTTPTAVERGARAMYEDRAETGYEDGMVFIDWDEMLPEDRAKECRAFAAGRAALWMPIETAPKDGTKIILCWPNQGNVMQVCWWSKVHQNWIAAGTGASVGNVSGLVWFPVFAPPAAGETK